MLVTHCTLNETVQEKLAIKTSGSSALQISNTVASYSSTKHHTYTHIRTYYFYSRRYCREGHNGTLCAVCIKGWHRRSSTSTCTQCPDDMSKSIWWTAGLSAGITVAVVIVVLLDLRFGWSRAKPGSQLLKLMINCVQQMTVMILFPVDWPDAVKDMGTLFASFSIDVSFVSPTCLGVPFDFFSRFVLSSGLVLASIVVPWVAAAIAALVAACRGRSRCGQKKRRQGGAVAGGVGDRGGGGVSSVDTPTFRQIFWARWRRVQPTAARYSLMIMLFAHPAVSGQTFFFFSCREIDGDMYLIADYSLRCHETEWLRLLPFALFMVVFFVMGVPLLLLILLVKYRAAIKKIGRAVDEALAEAAVLNETGAILDIDQARALYRQVDVDNSGSIDFSEFTKFWLNHNEGEDGMSGELTEIARMISQSKDSPEDVELLIHRALDLVNRRVVHCRSIRRKGTGTAIGNDLVAPHAAEQDEEDAPTVHEGTVEGRHVTRNVAGDVQGATLARERVAAEGDGVEMMLGVLWLNYKPEYFFFDM